VFSTRVSLRALATASTLNMFAEAKDKALPKVGGTTFDKVLYLLVVLVAAVIFILGLVTIAMSASEPITKIKTTQVAQLPFPGIGLCIADSAPVDHMQFASGDNWQREVPVANLRNKKGFHSLAKADITTLSKSLEALHPGTQCTVINGDGALQAKPGMALDVTMKLDADNYWSGSHTHFLTLFDPKLTFEEQENNLLDYPFNFVNYQVSIFFTVDKFVDKTQTGLFNRFSDGTVMEEDVNVNVTHKYTASVQSVPYFSFTGKTVANVQLEGKIQIVAAGYAVRVVSTRYKIFTEILAEVGASWSSVALLLSLFFVTKTVPAPDINLKVHMLRFRGDEKQRGFARDFVDMRREMGSDASDTKASDAKASDDKALDAKGKDGEVPQFIV